jgi:hypothetical protein
MTSTIGDLSVALTQREEFLATRINFDFEDRSNNLYSWDETADAMEELMESLLGRDAIPLARHKFFSDPDYYVGGHGRSAYKHLRRTGRAETPSSVTGTSSNTSDILSTAPIYPKRSFRQSRRRSVTVAHRLLVATRWRSPTSRVA